MISKDILTNKYGKLIENMDYNVLMTELNQIKPMLDMGILSRQIPILIYTQVNRNALYYLLGVTYSLIRDKVLDYEVVSGQTFIREHFADSDRDQVLYSSIYYTELLFLSLTQADYTSEYMETLIQDLVEFRARAGRLTIISYGITPSNNTYIVQTKKLREFMDSNNYGVLTLNKKGITTEHSETNSSDKTKTPKGRPRPRRIV